MYEYILSDKNPDIFTVGTYSSGEWEPESDHLNSRAAAERVAYLNGTSERYFLWDDGDGHQYCVPVRLKSRTDELDYLRDSEEGWFTIFNEIEPQLISVEGVLTFTNPKTE